MEMNQEKRGQGVKKAANFFPKGVPDWGLPNPVIARNRLGGSLGSLGFLEVWLF